MTESTHEPNTKDPENWQQDVLNKLIFASYNEQRRARRWNIFFKSLFMAYMFLLLIIMLLPSAGDDGKRFSTGNHTALIEINGVIAQDAKASADHVIHALRAAFKEKKAAGIILRINSPGGSPVQAGYIYDEIKRLRTEHKDKKVYAVITDICASGGYYIASAADEIYADKASLVGSIGVVMNGFGFVDTLKKLGVERRLYTAGEHKGFLDPFSPQRREETAHIKQLLNEIHNQFIKVVKDGRGARLKDDPKLFSGLIWTGEESVKLGLVDGLNSSSAVARDIIKADKIVDYTPQENLLERLTQRLGTSISSSLLQQAGATNNLVSE